MSMEVASDLGFGSDDMGRTIENLVYTEIPYSKFKNMTPEDYEQIVNLYKDDPKLRIQLLNKYKGEFLLLKEKELNYQRAYTRKQK